MYHHPNTEGHRHLAAMLACLLDRALLETRDRLLVRPRPLPMDAVEATGSASGTRRVTQTRPTFALLLAEASANQLSHAKLSAFMRNRSGSSLTSSSSPTSTFPSCKFVGMPPLLLSKNRTAADGWWRRNHGLLAASKPNATLHLPFSCSSPGCGLTVALTQSYQPLGLLDLYVDGVPVGSKVSAANPMWARSRHPVWTVQSLHVAVSPRRPGASKGGLDRGLHTLLIVARGQTLPMVESLNLSTNYERHEVHVRGGLVQLGGAWCNASALGAAPDLRTTLALPLGLAEATRGQLRQLPRGLAEAIRGQLRQLPTTPSAEAAKQLKWLSG